MEVQQAKTATVLIWAVTLAPSRPWRHPSADGRRSEPGGTGWLYAQIGQPLAGRPPTSSAVIDGLGVIGLDALYSGLEPKLDLPNYLRPAGVTTASRFRQVDLPVWEDPPLKLVLLVDLISLSCFAILTMKKERAARPRPLPILGYCMYLRRSCHFQLLTFPLMQGGAPATM